MSEKKLVYLAAPYSHEDMAVKIKRFERINTSASILMAGGVLLFSPISHTHPIALAGALPGNWEFWADYDRAMLENCKKIIVLKLDGWKESTGVTAEIAIAEEFGIPVEYLDPEPEE